MSLTRKVGYFVLTIAVIGGGQAILGGDVQTSPDPEVQGLEKPTMQMIDQNHVETGDAHEFTATIQNTGEDGNFFVTLWFGPETPEELPDVRSELRAMGFDRVRTQSLYFDSGERREISFRERSMDGASSYAIYGYSKTYAADIVNNGATGAVNASLFWEDSDTGDRELVQSQLVTIQEGETRRVAFSVEEHMEFDYPEENYDTWVVRSEPAE